LENTVLFFEQQKNGAFFGSFTHPSCLAVGFDLLDAEFDRRCLFLGGRIPTTEGKLRKNLSKFLFHAMIVDRPIQFVNFSCLIVINLVILFHLPIDSNETNRKKFGGQS
jgi:hypothetical protein